MNLSRVILAVVFAVTSASSMAVSADQKNNKSDARFGQNIQLGPRPYFLVNDMEKSDLKKALQQCSEGPFYKSDFSIGHRGAPLQFPEHTQESYEAAARMGAGIVECDVTFTKDKELVCRHSQCDLETTTNILETNLAGKCSVQPDLGSETPYKNVSCCTSDITLAEFKTLKGKMDAGNRNAKTLSQFMNATASFRTDLYSSKGTLLTHRESIRLFKKLGVKMTPELKSASVAMPFNGFTQQAYAQKMINEYKMEGVPAKNVYPQSFGLEDVRYWITNEPKFGKQAVYLETLDVPDQVPAAITKLPSLAAEGVKIVAPPMWVLVTLDANNKIVPSEYARAAKAAGLEIITWTIERSGLLKNGGGYYYQSITDGIKSDGDMMVLLDVLAQDVGIMGIFSDWPATVTYYANCMNLK
ncbi:MAG: glycerophosphodiester phosphodiesterase family protein [Methylicorpusculum sp.]|uniref:glycerophosphodiester phosphodiesterase family protein n=1 Tax=Methylicorpusculum sp. TaxID=2713644 RepID=UPI002721BA18|nr:glycerophosphodiester phosphodiesterase family protein [Methylicorpusculum sp.]MDO8938290.1 glycerophosphodiester phosphodiesterase family protein [Methylicorpusculum sp.]MDP2204637.1 glycerophosphodiester phosphodiesterase family protein [Methylicorpusculum sp.]